MINLMFCGNEKVFDGFLIASLSIRKYTKEALNMYLFTMDLTDINSEFKPLTEIHRKTIEEKLKEKNSESRVTLIDATNVYRKEMENNTNKNTHYTPYIFLRLLCDKIPNLPEKMIYLDADIVCYRDIKELYDIDISDYDFGAARDYIGRKWISKNYLNSGVLLFNLKKMFENDSFAKCREMCLKKKMMLPDQTALNRVCKDKLILDDKFNEQKRRKDETLIRHFSMEMLYFPIIRPRNIKPWEIDKIHEILNIHDYDDIYEEFLNTKKCVKYS